MPGGDRTGPLGMGAMSGRRVGFCAGYGMPGYANPYPGRGFGPGFGAGRGARGRGFGAAGRGWRNRFNAFGWPGWIGFDRQELKAQAEAMEAELEAIRKRLSEMEPKTDEA